VLPNLSSTTDRISFRQRADRELENGWVSIQIEVGRAVGQRDPPSTAATPCLLMAMTAAILHQQRLPKGQAVVAAGAIRAVQCFPVDCILDQQTSDLVYEDTAYGLQYISPSRQLRDTTDFCMEGPIITTPWWHIVEVEEYGV
jgi:hypothetical protein